MHIIKKKNTNTEKYPKIVLLTNDEVGLETTKYLKNRQENIVALVLHHEDNAKFSKEIRKIAGVKKVFYNFQLRERDVIEEIKKLEPDIGICAWFGYILKKEFIEIFPLGCINFHNGYLPYNRGKYPQSWAIFNNSKYGVTIHFINEDIDSGDIIGRKGIKIDVTDNGHTLYEHSKKEMVKLFKTYWPKIKKGGVKTFPQNHKIATTHFAKNISALDFIDINKQYKAKDLINQIRSRSFNNRTYAYFLHKGKKIFVKLKLSYEQFFD